VTFERRTTWVNRIKSGSLSISYGTVPHTATVIAVLAVFVSSASARNHSFQLVLLPSLNAVEPGVPGWKLGAPVTVIVRMLNNTKRVVHFGLTNPGWDYEMDVRDGRGRPVPESDALKKLKEDLKNGPGFVFRNMSVTLQPHQSADDTIEVSYFYKLDYPGRYSIQVRRKFHRISNKLIRSNRLTLNVNP
jgi:hypothetical protein